VNVVAGVLVGLVAALHLCFLVLEMFLWTTPTGRRVFGFDPEFAERSKGLAANQGLYNGFLAAGLLWGSRWGRAASGSGSSSSPAWWWRASSAR
jgi:putative membrane protein